MKDHFFSSLKLNRRSMLAGLAAAGGTMAVPATVAAQAMTAGQQSFATLAKFLTAKPALNEIFIQAVHAVASKDVPNFEASVTSLNQRIEQQKPADVSALFTSFTDADAETRKFALLMIETFYTGNLGRGSSAKAVAYEMALMFPPTLDKTVIPSYVRGKPSYWTVNP